MSTTADTPETARPTDIAWAQNLIADMQRDAALLERWAQAEAAFCWADAHQTTAPTEEQRTLLRQLISLGDALDADTQRLHFLWDYGYAPITTSPERLAQVEAVIFAPTQDEA